jgi:Vitelline membrane outer layer protein I (VOMI)
MKQKTFKRGLGAATACVVALGLFVGGCAVDASDGGSDASQVDGLKLPPPGEFHSGSVEGDASTQKACQVTRPDVVTSVTIGAGHWGSWNCWDYCSAGSYAYGVSQKSESPRGSGDDTALNGVRLDCYYKNNASPAGFVTSGQSGWGAWQPGAFAQPFTTSNPFVGGRMRIEGPQGSGDDSAGNQVAMTAVNGVESLPSSMTGWGSWNSTTSCPLGTAVCGIQTRTEPNRGSGDDTALNGVNLACCLL